MTIISHCEAALTALHRQGEDALALAGDAAVQQIRQVMLTGYGQPIRETGALMGDVTHRVTQQQGELTLTAGNTLDYALPVHEGTHRIPGRPYLRDGFLLALPQMMEGLRQGLGG